MSETQIDFEGLGKVLEAARAAPLESIDMRSWACGTKGCLVGHFCMANPGDTLKLRRNCTHLIPSLAIADTDLEGAVGIDAVQTRFGLTHDTTIYLFGLGSPADDPGGADLSPMEAIARLEAFIINQGRR